MAPESPTCTVSDDPKLAVFFDGGCPLCRREIGFYQGLKGAADIQWVDVSNAPEGEVAPDLRREDALRRFHVRDREGRLVSGGRAFAELWAGLPSLSVAGRIGRLPPIALLLEGAYRLFLPVRPWLQRLFRHKA